MPHFCPLVSKLLFLTFKCRLNLTPKFQSYVSISSVKLNTKKKFMVNSFKFQNEFKQTLEDMNTSSNTRIVSADLLSNAHEFSEKSHNSFPKQKRKISSLKYQGEILFGIHPVYLALLQNKRTFYKLFIRKFDSDEGFNRTRKEEIIHLSESLNIPISHIDSKGLRALTSDAVHQGVCLDAGFLQVPLWDDQVEYQKAEERPLWLVLDEILDPMNVGAIIRSAYYFGVNKIFVVVGNSCKLSPTVSKASSGALEIMDIHYLENLEEFIMNRKNNGWCIASTSAYLENKESNKLTTSVTEFNTTKPTILILGNEGRGVSPTIQNLCDTLISIHPGRILHQGLDSLNVSVAAGVLLHVLNNMKDRRNT